MDNLTHSLVGALLSQAGLKKLTGRATAALVIAANLPDCGGEEGDLLALRPAAMPIVD